MTQIDALPLARIDHDPAKALKAAVSTDDGRPLLHYVLIRDRVAEATNGSVMVRVPLRDGGGEEFALPEDCEGNRFLLPGAALEHVRPGTALEIDMRTGEVWVVPTSAEGREGYPIELPRAEIETEGRRYPNLDAIIPAPDNEYRRLTLGAPVIRAMAAFAGGNAKEPGKLVLMVPPETEDAGQITTAVVFRRQGPGSRSGLIMPMRTADQFEETEDTQAEDQPADPAQLAFEAFPEAEGAA